MSSLIDFVEFEISMCGSMKCLSMDNVFSMVIKFMS